MCSNTNWLMQGKGNIVRAKRDRIALHFIGNSSIIFKICCGRFYVAV